MYTILMPSLEELQKNIDQINLRNQRVEVDKAWETSWSRKVLIIALTYIVIVTFFVAAELPRPFINAIVPVVAFTISTLTIGMCKTWWLKTYYKK